jgi:hypothetical protein
MQLKTRLSLKNTNQNGPELSKCFPVDGTSKYNAPFSLVVPVSDSIRLRATRQGEEIKSRGSLLVTMSSSSSLGKAEPIWVSQRQLRSVSNRSLNEANVAPGFPIKCTCGPDAVELTVVKPSSRRQLLRKCESCRLSGMRQHSGLGQKNDDAQVLPDIVRRAQIRRASEKASMTLMANAQSK